jgi:hypothetical protein
VKIELKEETVRELRAATIKALSPTSLTIGRLARRHTMGDDELRLLVNFIREASGITE